MNWLRAHMFYSISRNCTNAKLGILNNYGSDWLIRSELTKKKIVFHLFKLDVHKTFYNFSSSIFCASNKIILIKD